jgi:hypothetical protein
MAIRFDSGEVGPLGGGSLSGRARGCVCVWQSVPPSPMSPYGPYVAARASLRSTHTLDELLQLADGHAAPTTSKLSERLTTLEAAVAAAKAAAKSCVPRISCASSDENEREEAPASADDFRAGTCEHEHHRAR